MPSCPGLGQDVARFCGCAGGILTGQIDTTDREDRYWSCGRSIGCQPGQCVQRCELPHWRKLSIYPEHCPQGGAGSGRLRHFSHIFQCKHIRSASAMLVQEVRADSICMAQ